MAAASAQTLQRIAAETRLPAATLEKVLRLFDVLQAVAEDRALKTRLALKGGTALNVFYLHLDRLSADIDLNYVRAIDRAEMEADRPLVDDALLRLLEAQGYQVRRQPRVTLALQRRSTICSNGSAPRSELAHGQVPDIRRAQSDVFVCRAVALGTLRPYVYDLTTGYT